MYTAKIFFKPYIKSSNYSVEELFRELFSHLRLNGQALGTYFIGYYKGDNYEMYISIPEPGSWKLSHTNKYVKEKIKKIEADGVLEFIDLGKDIGVDGKEYSKKNTPPFYILYTNYTCLNSPLRSGDTFEPVPLYRVPHTYEQDPSYYDIICWQSNYKNCDQLQMGCEIGEKFATRQISHIDSDLTKQGRDICQRIEGKTGIPTYYYIYRYTAYSLTQESKRVCPGCGGKWILKEQLFHRFDFKCDHCRLLSNISWSAK